MAYIEHSTDPETLYYGGFQDFEYEKGGWQKIIVLQGELFMLCRKAGQEWAK
ncbi:hypothetical protein KKA24_03060 [Patescibacteria group bacterium]|nr:hypothetical protein [Patescibacteria group bacterium]